MRAMDTVADTQKRMFEQGCDLSAKEGRPTVRVIDIDKVIRDWRRDKVVHLRLHECERLAYTIQESC